ncbi:MAG: ketopantoate reductase family protein [Anaerolineales bacterium]
MENEPILIVGSGAMACLFGARLASQREVIMLATWPEGIEALRTHGIREKGEAGWKQHPVSVVEDPSSLAPVRYALVLVKAWQTESAAQGLKVCLAEDGVALSLQNGLGNMETLSRTLGEVRAAMGVTTYGATLLGPGQVRPAGEGTVELGNKPGLETLSAWLEEAGFEVRLAEDVRALAWGKLAVNAGINPLTALLNVRNGWVSKNPDARWISEAAVREVQAVAEALGIDLPQADPVAATMNVTERTAQNRSSMLQDLARGAPTEIEAICGQVVSHGHQAGVPTPVNELLWRLVRSKAKAEGAEIDRH